MIAATPVLIPGTICDARLWTDRVRDALPGAIDAHVTRDASIEAMASRALAAASGPLLPVGSNRSDAALPALVRDMAMALGPDIFVAQSEALRTRRDLRPVVPALASPLLVACGAEDRLCPPAGHRTLAQSAPGATLHVIEGAGHMLPLEQPARLASIIRQWREAA